MTLERESARGLTAATKRPFRAIKLAWVLNALAALLVWIGVDGANEILGQVSPNQDAFPLFLTGAISGALADVSAGLMRFRPPKRRSRTSMGGSEVLVGLSIVLLVVSVVCLVLGIAAAATGLLDLVRI